MGGEQVVFHVAGESAVPGCAHPRLGSLVKNPGSSLDEGAEIVADEIRFMKLKPRMAAQSGQLLPGFSAIPCSINSPLFTRAKHFSHHSHIGDIRIFGMDNNPSCSGFIKR
jgi:hypothetical protein